MAGPTILKRRLWWDDRSAEMLRKDGRREDFYWSLLSRDILDEDGNPLRKEPFWNLFWDGVGTEDFSTEIELKLYLIRLAYDVGVEFLVPSILLYDAGLWYSTDDWVDTFHCSDKNDEIEAFSGIYPGKMPEKRRLHLAGTLDAAPPRKSSSVGLAAALVAGFLFGQGQKKKPKKSSWVNTWSSYVKEDETPDEECVFVIPVSKCECKDGHFCPPRKKSAGEGEKSPK